MIIKHENIEKHNLGGGIIMQVLGVSNNMNVLHWDMEDQSEVKNHSHSQEQFGLIIKGQLDLTILGETDSLKSGDAYFIPADAEHSFIAIGKTEAIDVFSPIKKTYANSRIDGILAAIMANGRFSAKKSGH